MNKQKFNNQTVIVTGGTKGIGKAIAIAFADKNTNDLITVGNIRF